MKQIKQWYLPFFDETDIEYVKGLGCEYEVINGANTIEVTASNGQRYRIIDSTQKYGLYITTDNTDDKKKESLLLLKYQGKVSLLRSFYVNEWERYEFQ